MALGGNIGVPVLDLAPPAAGRIHVLECSTFQIDLAPSLAPSVGLLINMTPDHLDRHGRFAHYAAIKERLVAASGDGAGRARRRILPRDRRAAARAGRQPRSIGVSRRDSPRRRTCSSTTTACWRAATPRRSIDSRIAPALRGAHNGAERGLRLRRGAGARRRGATSSRAASRPFPASPIAWSRSADRPRRCSSTIPKRPTPTRPRRRCCRSATSTGSSAARRRRAGSSRCARCFRACRKAYLIGAATEDFAANARRRRSPSSAAGRSSAAPPPRPRRRARRARRSRWCCCRRPAPPTINSPISRRAATRSALAFVEWLELPRRGARSDGGLRPWSREPNAAPSPIGCAPSIPGCSAPSAALMAIGVVMALAASPAVAERIGLSTVPFRRPAGALLIPRRRCWRRRRSCRRATLAAPRCCSTPSRSRSSCWR